MKKHYQFYLKDEKEDQLLKIFIQDNCNGNEAKYIREILNKIRKGELVSPSDEDLKKEKMKIDIEYKKTQVELNKLRITYFNTFGTEPSDRGERALKQNVKSNLENPSCYDEKNNRFQCPECGILVVIKGTISQAKEEFADHYNKKHGIIPENIFKELCEIK